MMNEDIETPVRSWINCNLEDWCSKISQSRVVDYDRFFSCTTDIVKAFFDTSKPFIENKSPALIFVSDELGLDPTLKKKYIVPDNIIEFIVKNAPIQIPHFTIMFSHNLIGPLIPPLVLIPNLQNWLEEIEKYINLGQIWCISTENVWKKRESYLIWCIKGGVCWKTDKINW